MSDGISVSLCYVFISFFSCPLSSDCPLSKESPVTEAEMSRLNGGASAANQKAKKGGGGGKGNKVLMGRI